MSLKRLKNKREKVRIFGKKKSLLFLTILKAALTHEPLSVCYLPKVLIIQNKNSVSNMIFADKANMAWWCRLFPLVGWNDKLIQQCGVIEDSERRLAVLESITDTMVLPSWHLFAILRKHGAKKIYQIYLKKCCPCFSASHLASYSQCLLHLRRSSGCDVRLE